MTSLISIYNFRGHFIDQFLETVNITQKLSSMDSGTIVISNNNPKLTEDLILPGNYVIVQDKNMSVPWIGVISVPTSSNETQTTIALIDPKDILVGLPIIDTIGIGIGVISLQGILFAIEKTRGTDYEHQFTFNPEENEFREGRSFLEKEGTSHLGKDIYTFLNELAKEKGFEWWLEPAISGKGILSLKIRIQDIRKSIGKPIYVPKNARVQGVGLAYSKKFYTAIGLIHTGEDVPRFDRLIRFPKLRNKFGTRILIVEKKDIEGESKTTSIKQLFKDNRPRRTIQLHLDTQYTELISSVKIGSVHQVVLGNIGFTHRRRGTILAMRVIAQTYNTSENVIGIVLEEYFDTDESVVLRM